MTSKAPQKLRSRAASRRFARKHAGELAAFTILLLAAFALRVYRLETQSIWVDEGISLHLATARLAEIVVNRATNIHPPLYFFLLKGWLALAGNGQLLFAARFFSVIFSLLQVPVVYTVGRRWLSSKTET